MPRKLFLVSTDFLENFLKRQQVANPDPLLDQQMQLDNQAEQLLKQNLPDDIKLRKLNNIITQYLNYGNMRNQSITPSSDSKDQAPPTPPATSQFIQDIITRAPQTSRPRIRLITNAIKQQPDTISWNERNGAVIVKGKEIPQSKFDEILYRLTAAKSFKKPLPLGYNEVFNVLNELKDFESDWLGNAIQKKAFAFRSQGSLPLQFDVSDESENDQAYFDASPEFIAGRMPTVDKTPTRRSSAYRKKRTGKGSCSMRKKGWLQF